MNNEPNNQKDDVALKFLTEGLPSKEGNLIIRAYFVIGSGDPDSAPVATATLLTACTRKMAEMPTELYQLIKEFRVVMSQARALQDGLIQDIRRHTSQIVTGFKDEAVRASNVVTQAIHQNRTQSETITEINDNIRDKAQRMVLEMDRTNSSTSQLRCDLQDLQKELKLQGESLQKVAEAAQTIKSAQVENQKLVSHLAKQASIHWLTIGFVAGAVMIGASDMFPPWVTAIVFIVGIGLIQGLFRVCWNAFFEESQKLK